VWPDGGVVVYEVSVQHREVPPAVDAVRAEVLVEGYLLEPVLMPPAALAAMAVRKRSGSGRARWAPPHHSHPLALAGEGGSGSGGGGGSGRQEDVARHKAARILGIVDSDGPSSPLVKQQPQAQVSPGGGVHGAGAGSRRPTRRSTLGHAMAMATTVPTI
jgi:hypothetical protein